MQIKQMIFNHILQEYSEDEYLQFIPADDEITQIIRYEKQKFASEKAEIHDPLTYDFKNEGKILRKKKTLREKKFCAEKICAKFLRE
jgi:hypothetical protein